MRRLWWVAGTAAFVGLYVVAAVIGSGKRAARLREVDDGGSSSRPFAPGEFEVRVFGPDGLPVPRGWIRVAEVRPNGGGSGGLGTFDGVQRHRSNSREEGSTLWIEFLLPVDRAGSPLPFGAVLLPRIPRDRPLVEIRLPQEKTVEGTVLDPEGKPIEGANVRAFPVLPEEVAGLFADEGRGFHEEALTDAGGGFRIARLGDMEYRIVVALPPDLSQVEPVRVAAGTEGVEIRSGRNTPPLVTVVDAKGDPIPGVGVLAEEDAPVSGPGTPRRPVRPRGSSAAAKTDARGRAWLPGLDRDRQYRLSATPATTAFGWESRDGWIPRDETIVLHRFRSLAFRAEDPAGNPLPVLSFRCWREGDEWCFEGSQSPIRVPEGPLLAWAMVEGSFDVHPEGREVAVAADARQVRLVLDPGLEASFRIAGAPPGATVRAQACSDDRGSYFAPQRREDWLTWRGLRQGESCRMVVTVADSDLCALVEEFQGGDPERVVALAPGRTVKGRVEWPSGAEPGGVGVERRGLVLAAESVGKDGTFTVRGVPPGDWTAVARATLGGEPVKAETPAGEGEAVIRFR